MLDLTIYSYGYSEIIYHTLQAIAMFRNSNFYTTIIATIGLISGFTYAIKMVAARVDSEWRDSLKRIIGMVIFIQALLLPTATMRVKDNVEKNFWYVDNIPVAFALPIGIFENFGHILTAGFEQVFSLVGGASSHSYYHYGTVFGARLQKEVLQSKVRDPEFISNMSNFLERCVILPSMIGKQFTKEELVSTEDMWGLISSRAGTFTRTPMTVNGIKVSPHPTCRDVIPYFEKRFIDTIAVNIFSMAWKFKGAGRESRYNAASRALNQNIKTQIGALYGKDSSKVDALLKHNMMINAVNNYRSGKYPAAKALMHSEAGGLISGDLAEKTLTGSLAVMKVIIYGSYIFLFPILLLSGGIAKYRGWITAAFSLALWPALFSMLNMIIDFAYQPATIISYSTWSTELKKFDSIASTAANLTLMIPFLSFWITRMGEGGLMHLAGSIMATANSASSALAGEKASGSRSWDNESIGNQSNNNVSNNKHDSSMQYVSGSVRSQMSDGTMETITPGGKALYFGGSGQTASSGESTYRLENGVMTSLQEGVRNEDQIMKSEQASLTKSQEKLAAQEASALHSIMQSMKKDSGKSIDTSTEEGKQVMKAINEIDAINKTNEYGWEQNAEAHIKADCTLGGAISKFFGAEVGVGGSVSASNKSSQSDSGSSSNIVENNAHNNKGNSERISKTENHLESLGVDKNSQQSMRETYQESKRLEKSISAHQDKIDSYNKSMDYTQSHASQYSKDMYQEVADGYQEKHGGSARQAHDAASAGTREARDVFKKLSSREADAILSRIHNQGSAIQNSNEVETLEKNNSIDSNIGVEVKKFSADNSILTDVNEAEEEIEKTESKIKNEFEIRSDETNDEYLDLQDSSKRKREKKEEKLNTYEEDRIGTGWVSGWIGGLGRLEPGISNNGLDFEPLGQIYQTKSRPAPFVIASEDFDPKEAQAIIDEFAPDKTTQGSSGVVDPKK